MASGFRVRSGGIKAARRVSLRPGGDDLLFRGVAIPSTLSAIPEGLTALLARTPDEWRLRHTSQTTRQHWDDQDGGWLCRTSGATICETYRDRLSLRCAGRSRSCVVFAAERPAVT